MRSFEPSGRKVVPAGHSRSGAVNNKPAVKPLSKMSATEINALPEKDFLAKLKPGTRSMLKDLWAIAPYLKK